MIRRADGVENVRENVCSSWWDSIGARCSIGYDNVLRDLTVERELISHGQRELCDELLVQGGGAGREGKIHFGRVVFDDHAVQANQTQTRVSKRLHFNGSRIQSL
jgi:hypothetical protein